MVDRWGSPQARVLMGEIGDALGMSKQAAWEGFRKYTDGYRESAWPGIYSEARDLAGDSADS